MNTEPSTLKVAFDARSDFDTGLLAVSEKEHHSKCYFGNKAKIEAALSPDELWSHARAKFMPERGEIHFTYGGYRYAQKMTPSDVEWLDRFDTSRPVRSKTLTLDPNGPLTRVLGEARATGGVKRPRKSPSREATGVTCGGHRNGNSGRAKRIQAIVQARLDATQPAPAA